MTIATCLSVRYPCVCKGASVLPPALWRKGACQGLLMHLTFRSEDVDSTVIKSTELDSVWVQNPGLAPTSCVTFSRLLNLSVP